MTLTENAMVTVLLCSQLGGADSNVQPYTISEWSILAQQLINSNVKEPRNLISMTTDDIQNRLNINEEQAYRISSLLSRAANISFLLNELEQKSIYVVTISDIKYPKRLRKALGRKAPPLLYYCGNLELIDSEGIAIVGSRNIDAQGEIFAGNLARKAVTEGYSIFSGGAKGVDKASEQAALQKGGCCISFLSDSMTKKIRNADTRNALINGKLLLLSAVNPDASFSAGNAMSRNRYIYPLSMCAFVVSSDYNKGGTWYGAINSIKNGLVNTYIWNNPKYEGNTRLIAEGGLPISELKNFSVKDLVSAKIPPKPEQLDLFSI